jgi:hypothetical protein
MVTGVMSKEGGVATVFNAEISRLRCAILRIFGNPPRTGVRARTLADIVGGHKANPHGLLETPLPSLKKTYRAMDNPFRFDTIGCPSPLGGCNQDAIRFGIGAVARINAFRTIA